MASRRLERERRKANGALATAGGIEVVAVVGATEQELVLTDTANESEKIARGLSVIPGAAEVAVLQISDAEAAVRQDDGLTGLGRQRELRKRALEVLGALKQKARFPLEAAAQRRAVLVKKVAPPITDPATALRAGLREQEIRAHLMATVDPLALPGLLGDAVKAGDRETFSAILDAPTSFEFFKLGAEDRVRFERMRDTVHDSETAGEIALLDHWVDIVRGKLAAVESFVDSLTPDAMPDLLLEIVEGRATA